MISFFIYVEGMKLLSPYKVNTLVANKISPLKHHTYNTCKNGCTMFFEEGIECPNQNCQQVSSELATFTHKQFSIKDLLSQFLDFEKNRRKLEYKGRVCGDNNFKDFYNGRAYKEIIPKNANEENTIDLQLYVDGFCPQNSRSRSMTMVMFSILNIDPRER